MKSTARHVIHSVVEVVKSHDEVHSMAVEVEVNELNVKDVGDVEAKQGRVLEVVALAPADTE